MRADRCNIPMESIDQWRAWYLTSIGRRVAPLHRGVVISISDVLLRHPRTNLKSSDRWILYLSRRSLIIAPHSLDNLISHTIAFHLLPLSCPNHTHAPYYRPPAYKSTLYPPFSLTKLLLPFLPSHSTTCSHVKLRHRRVLHLSRHHPRPP